MKAIYKSAFRVKTADFDDEEATWILTCWERDRENERVDPSMIDTDAFFRAGSPVVDNHDTSGSVNRVLLGSVTETWEAEIGEGTSYPQPGGPPRPALLGKIRWNLETQAGREAKASSDAGHLVAGSISFTPTEPPRRNEFGGVDYHGVELIEFSLCPAGAVKSAVRIKRRKSVEDHADAVIESLKSHEKADLREISMLMASLRVLESEGRTINDPQVRIIIDKLQKITGLSAEAIWRSKSQEKGWSFNTEAPLANGDEVSYSGVQGRYWRIVSMAPNNVTIRDREGHELQVPPESLTRARKAYDDGEDVIVESVKRTTKALQRLADRYDRTNKQLGLLGLDAELKGFRSGLSELRAKMKATQTIVKGYGK